MTVQPVEFPSLTGNPVYFRTYSRFTKQGRETWQDTISRTTKGTVKLGGLNQEQADLLQNQALQLKSMPSGRSLWVMGTDWLEDPANFSGVYNCSSFNITSFERMAFMMSLGMMGVGTGTVLEDKYISQLPAICTQIDLIILGHPGDLEPIEDTRVDRSGSTIEITIGDSRAGWCDAYRTVLELSATPHEEYLKVFLQLGHIRAAGTIIKGFGGVTNPVGIQRKFNAIVEILNSACGRQLLSTEVCLILDETALETVAGNVRRCISYGARVSEVSGLKVIQDIVIGDRVLGSDGEYHLVTDTFDQGVQETLKIKTQLSSISVTPNHRMAVMDALNHYIWVEAKDLKVGDILISTPHTMGSDTISTDEAWLLGTYIADGHTDLENSQKRNGGGGSTIFSMSTTSLNTIGTKLTKCLAVKGYTPSVYTKDNSTKLAVYRKDLAEYLRQFKAPWGVPVIPESVWNGSIQIRASFLAGLWDGDGDTRSVLNSTKLEFLAEVQKLYLSLGIAVNLNIRADKIVKGKTYEGCHNLTVVGQQSKLALKALVAPFLARLDYVPSAMNRSNLRLPNIFSTKKSNSNSGHNWDGFVADELADGSLIPCPITSIEPGQTVQTYDIEVADVHEFMVEGLLSHNSANMRQFDAWDIAAMSAKDNMWTQDAAGNWTVDPKKDAYRMGNHTRVFHKKPTLAECVEAVTKQFWSGEGAIQWAGESVARANADLLNTPERKHTFLAEYNLSIDAARDYLEFCNGGLLSVDELDHRMQRYGINPCFAAGTQVLTRDGVWNIEDLVGKTVEVWDGKNWVAINNFRITGGNQPVYELTLSQQSQSYRETVTATEYHTFILENGSRVELKDLKVGDLLMGANIPDQDLNESIADDYDGQSFYIESIDYIGVAANVYCCTVRDTHSFTLANGLLVGNCGEIIGTRFMCNLYEVHSNMIDPYDLAGQKDAFKAGGLGVAVLLNHQFIDPEQAYSRELDPIVGVSITGLFDFFVHAFGADWLRWWALGRPDKFSISLDGWLKCKNLGAALDIGDRVNQEFTEAIDNGVVYRSIEAAYLSMWRQTVEETVSEYCTEHGLKVPNRSTTVQPSGTKSLLTGASPGWHPPKATQFIRRMTFRRNDPVALACIDFGYSVIPSQADKDENNQLLDDPYDPRCTEWLVEIPISTSWADLDGVAEIDISKLSALAQMDFYMIVQEFYVTHNTSATIEFTEAEILPLATKIHQLVEQDRGYISAALLARFDDEKAKSFPRLPFEPIDRGTYLKLVAEVESRASGESFADLLAKYDLGAMTAEVGPAGCDSDKCLMAEKTPNADSPETFEFEIL